MNRYFSFLLMLAFLITPALAQDDDDTLLLEDGDFLIYRSEDGALKIKRTDADDDDWLAVIDGKSSYHFRVDTKGDDDFDFWPSIVRFDNLRGHLAGELATFEGLGERTKVRSEILRMDMEAQKLARRIRVADGDERADLEEELDTLLGDIFEQKQELQAERLETLEEEADELRDRYSERERLRDEIIERRKRELLGERNVLDW